MKKLSLAALGLLIVMASCNDDDNTTPPSLSHTTDLMPLGVGKQWKYNTTTTYIQGSDTSLSIKNHQWDIIKDTLAFGIQSFVIRKQQTYISNGNSFTFNDYYQNTIHGLHFIGTNSSVSNDIFLKTNGIPFHPFSFDLSLNNTRNNSDSVTWINPAILVLKNPITLNESWNPYPGNLYLNDSREYLGNESVTVPAGTFNTLKLRHTIYSSTSHDLLIYQYYAFGKGLIKQEYHIVGNNPNNPPITISNITELTEVNF